MSNAVSEQGWGTKPLMEVATLQRGHDLPVQDRVDGAFPIFAANGPVGFHDVAKCDGPGVVTGRSGTIGKVHFVEGAYWPLNTALYVTDFHGNHPKWVYYMLQSFRLERFAQGAGVPTLNRNLVHGEPIRVPPLPEQRRIAAILDRADALRAKRREALAQLDSLTQSIFIEMFGAASDDQLSWPKVDLAEAAEVLTGYAFKSDEFVGPGSSTVRLCRGTNVMPGRIDWQDLACWPKEGAKGLSSFALQGGDIVLAMDRPWISEGFKIARISPSDCPALLVQRVARVRARANAVNDFLYGLLMQPEFAQHCRPTETTIPHISPKEIRSFELRLPPLALQEVFATRVQAVESLKATHRAALAECDALFASLQHRAFAGQL